MKISVKIVIGIFMVQVVTAITSRCKVDGLQVGLGEG